MTLEQKNEIRERLRIISKANGGLLRPSDVVADAKKPKSPLHNLFEWDDAKAAAAHRIEQARRLIRSVRVDVEVSDRMLTIPEYCHSPQVDHEEQGYTPVMGLQEHPFLSRAALRNELRMIRGSVERSRDIAEALGLEKEFQTMLDEVLGIVERVSVRLAA